MKNMVDGSRIIATGKWIGLLEIRYYDSNGDIRIWEAANRVNSFGAVVMIAKMIPSDRIILIRQFRPPVGRFVIEFPAGLIDSGETPEQAAVRELKEETGFSGKVIHHSDRNYSSPGLSSEFLYQMLMIVDENAQNDVQTKFDETEFIETHLVPVNEIHDFIKACEKNGDAVDAKVQTYLLALHSAAKME